jgi:parvulin-like peptidyl-prolyl isomerase
VYPANTSKKFLPLLSIGLILFLIFSCETGESKKSGVIATIGSDTITIMDLDQTVTAIPLPHRFEYKSEKALNDLVQSMIDWKLMAKEAVKLGLDKEAEVKSQLVTLKGKPASQTDQLLANTYTKKKQKELEEIPETEISNYYNTHKGEYTIPERVKIERVICKTEENAKAVREGIKQSMSFEEFMEQNPNFRRKITTLWLRKSGTDSEMEKVAFNLSVGEVSGVFETKAGYCLLRVLEKAPSTMRTYSEVQAGIKAKLEVQKQKALLDKLKQDLRKSVSITVNQRVIKAYLSKGEPEKKSPH